MADSATRPTHSALMDTIYRYQRHIYDITRKYYLLGRDDALQQLHPGDGESVLAIGCGTGRNLINARRLAPQARYFGLDISQAMLETAQRKIARAGFADDISLGMADATSFDPVETFGEDGFDRILISYAISMIPVWDDAIRHAARCLNPGGELHIVDFGQQQGLPVWFRAGLHHWLQRFHVTPRSTLPAILDEAAADIGATSTLHSLYRDYAWHAIIRKPA